MKGTPLYLLFHVQVNYDSGIKIWGVITDGNSLFSYYLSSHMTIQFEFELKLESVSELESFAVWFWFNPLSKMSTPITTFQSCWQIVVISSASSKKGYASISKLCLESLCRYRSCNTKIRIQTHPIKDILDWTSGIFIIF